LKNAQGGAEVARYNLSFEGGSQTALSLQNSIEKVNGN
jgi:hypothetical protein